MSESEEDLERWLGEERRLWLGRIGRFGPIAALAGAATQFFVYDVPWAGGALVVTALLLLLLIPLAAYAPRPDLVFHYMSCVFVGAVVSVSYARGGFILVVSFYLLLLPLGALMLRLRTVAIVWAAIVFACSLALYAVTELGMTPPRVSPGATSELVGWLIVMSALTGAGLIGIRNLEDREQAAAKIERELARHRRLESLGRLAGGVAHDFNNLLGIIQSSAEAWNIESEHVSRAAILDAVDRGAGLTRSLLATAHNRPEALRRMDAGLALRETAALVQRVVPETIEIELEAGSVVPIEVDARALGHALLNLCLNARDAMPRGGTLRLRCEAKELDAAAAAAVQHGSLRPGRYAVLSVEDRGVGIDAEDVATIFAPFQSSKGQTAGTGLGLHNVLEFTVGAGGAIAVTSAPGDGTTVSLLLPLCELAGGELDESDVTAPPPERGDGLRVLLVEDEDGVRDAMARMLRAAGVDVWAAASAEEALSIAETTEVDALLTDVLMPGMSGPRLVKELRKRGFESRVLFMTGYARSELTEVSDEVVLQKPVSRADALRALLADATD